MRLANHTHEDWTRLGRAVFAARIQAGHTDTQQWARLVGRSSRMLLGLERGEAVGGATVEAVERALGWQSQRAFNILDDSTALSPRVSLDDYDDEMLVAEVLRRTQGNRLGDVIRPLSMEEVRDADEAIALLDRAITERPDGTEVVTTRLLECRNSLTRLIAHDTQSRTSMPE